MENKGVSMVFMHAMIFKKEGTPLRELHKSGSYNIPKEILQDLCFHSAVSFLATIVTMKNSAVRGL